MSQYLNRRQILEMGALGFGSLAMSCLAGSETSSGSGSNLAHDLSPKSPHYKPQANAVIMMMQNGGPGQMDLFDPKPELTKFSGKIHPEKVEMFQPGSEGNTLGLQCKIQTSALT